MFKEFCKFAQLNNNALKELTFIRSNFERWKEVEEAMEEKDRLSLRNEEAPAVFSRNQKNNGHKKTAFHTENWVDRRSFACYGCFCLWAV